METNETLRSNLKKLADLHESLFNSDALLPKNEPDAHSIKKAIHILESLVPTATFQIEYVQNEYLKSFIIAIFESLYSLDDLETNLIVRLLPLTRILFVYDIDLESGKFNNEQTKDFYLNVSHCLLDKINEKWDCFVDLLDMNFDQECLMQLVAYAIYGSDFGQFENKVPKIVEQMAIFDLRIQVQFMLSLTQVVFERQAHDFDEQKGLSLVDNFYSSCFESFKAELSANYSLNAANSIDENCKRNKFEIEEIFFLFSKRVEVMCKSLSRKGFSRNEQLKDFWLKYLLDEADRLGDQIHEYIHFLDYQTLDNFAHVFLNFVALLRKEKFDQSFLENKSALLSKYASWKKLHKIAFWIFSHIEFDSKYNEKIDLILLDSVYILHERATFYSKNAWQNIKLFSAKYILKSNTEIFRIIADYCANNRGYNFNRVKDLSSLVYDNLIELIRRENETNSSKYLNTHFLNCMCNIAQIFESNCLNGVDSKLENDINTFYAPLFRLVIELFANASLNESTVFKMCNFYSKIFSYYHLFTVNLDAHFKSIELLLVKIERFTLPLDNLRLVEAIRKFLDYIQHILNHVIYLDKCKENKQFILNYVKIVDEILTKL